MTLEIRPMMNSSVEDVLAFKTCCGLKMMDQNLEIHVHNAGYEAVEVPSAFELIGDFGKKKIEQLTPPGVLKIGPGETRAFYCQMDEELWDRANRLVWRDTDQQSYEVDLKPAG